MASSQLAASEQMAALLEQFRSTKAEIAQRSAAQLSLIQLNLTVIGLVTGSIFVQQDVRILFVIPVICPIIGMMYLDHATSISHLGRFVQSKVWKEICSVAGAQMPDFEAYARRLELRRIERILLLGLPIIFMFAIIPGVALATPFVIGQLQLMKEEVLIFALPGAALVLVFLIYWGRFIWVGKRPSPTEM
jgi:hypothetical protein